MTSKFCRDCGEKIRENAEICPACGCRQIAPAAQGTNWAPVLSFLCPGLGQIMLGRPGAGFLWFFGTLLGYFMFIVPGICAHVACVMDAAKR